MGSLRLSRINREYSCTEIDLYEVLRLGLNSYNEYQTQFNRISTRYTAEWGVIQRARLEEIIKMPEITQRHAMHKQLRIPLIAAGEECCILWMYLKGYILNSFSVEAIKGHLEGAGKEYYTKALKRHWSCVDAIMVSGTNFISSYREALLQGGMPADFSDDFAAAKAYFDVKYLEFKRVEQGVGVLRDAKIKANNEIFRIVSAMFADGQKIFRNDPATRHRFTFSKILSHIRHIRTSGEETIN